MAAPSVVQNTGISYQTSTISFPNNVKKGNTIVALGGSTTVSDDVGNTYVKIFTRLHSFFVCQKSVGAAKTLTFGGHSSGTIAVALELTPSSLDQWNNATGGFPGLEGTPLFSDTSNFSLPWSYDFTLAPITPTVTTTVVDELILVFVTNMEGAAQGQFGGTITGTISAGPGYTQISQYVSQPTAALFDLYIVEQQTIHPTGTYTGDVSMPVSANGGGFSASFGPGFMYIASFYSTAAPPQPRIFISS